MKYSERSKKYYDSISMDLTPLIDVVFLLLLFFLVATTVKRDELAFHLGLPKAQNAAGVGKEIKQILVEISPDSYAFNGKKVGFEEMLKLMEAGIGNGSLKKDLPVFIRADETVSYKKVTDLLDALQKHEFGKISLVTEKTK